MKETFSFPEMLRLMKHSMQGVVQNNCHVFKTFIVCLIKRVLSRKKIIVKCFWKAGNK
jgi:hypothetical protein